jgi:hypothetical protein
MTVIDDLPATDAMNVAALVGADLADLAAVHDRDPVAHESAPPVTAADPALRCRVTDMAPLDALDAHPRAGLLVGVVPTRRRLGPRYEPVGPARMLLDQLGFTGPVEPEEQAWVADRSVTWLVVAPHRHDGHRAGRRCDRSGDPDCWRACAATTLDAALHSPHLWPGRIDLVALALLSHPPAEVSAAEVAAFDAELAARVGPSVLFIPHPVSGYEGP